MPDRISDTAPRIVVGVDGSPVQGHPVQGHPVQALLEAAAGEQPLVAGSPGHGTFTGIMLGSVSQHCVQRPPCPGVVVPAAGVPVGPDMAADPKPAIPRTGRW